MVKPGRKNCPCSLSICLVAIPLYNLKLLSYILKSHEYCCKNIITLETWDQISLPCSSFFGKNYCSKNENTNYLAFRRQKIREMAHSQHTGNDLTREKFTFLRGNILINQQLSTVGTENRSVFSLQEIPNSMNYWGILEVKFVPQVIP